MAALLQTKLFIPPTRPSLVARQRLIRKLDQACLPGCRAALLSAPAGFGKTTLVTQWLDGLNWQVSWLSLDESDNQPKRFFQYLIAALQKAIPSAGQSAGSLLELARLDLEEIITSLANDLADFPHPFIVVLDDIHQITTPQIHQAVQMLLDALPPQARLILLSRQDPPLSLARLRARGQLVEIRSDDLRFSAEETAAFLHQVMGLSLTLAQVHALEARTEGWIAGLQMAALSMQNLQDLDGFIQAFSGSNRFILDYLVEEVLSRQPEEVQSFLMSTSILKRFNSGLCAALLADEAPPTGDYQALLEQLDRANLFLVPLDNERCWYRYHHLFADLLQARLKATQPQRLAKLHRKASVWLEDHGEPKSALEHTLTGKDYQRSADLMDRYLNIHWRDTDLEFFRSVNTLPPEVLQSRPSLCLQAAWMAVITGQVQRVLPLVESAERHLLPLQATRPTALTRLERGQIAFARMLRAFLDDFANQTPALDDSLAQAVEAVPEDNIGMRNSIAVVLGTIYYMESDFQTAARYFQDAIWRDQQANGTNAVPIAGSRWARMLMVQGRLREALSMCQKFEAYVRERGARRYYLAGNLNILWGEALREWDQLDEAESQIREGMALHEGWPVPQALVIGFSALARVQIAKGELHAARESLEQAQRITQTSQISPDTAHNFQNARVRLWCAEGNCTVLEGWLAENPLPPTTGWTFRHESLRISRARALAALNRSEEAAALLHRLAQAVENSNRTGNQIEILTLLAAQLPEEQALPHLEKALRLAEPEGYRRVFLDAGPRLRQQMQALRARLSVQKDATLLGYLQTLLGEQPTRSQPPKTIEPLSEREREVLCLLAAGLSNQQIADRLVISIRTVKKHIQNIYAKLEVENRVQAVTRAAEYALL